MENSCEMTAVVLSNGKLIRNECIGDLTVVFIKFNDCCLFQTEKLNEMPIVYIRGSHPFGAHIPPNQSVSLWPTPESKIQPK